MCAWNLIVGILQLNLVLLPSSLLPSIILSSSLTMSTPIKYHDSVTPEPYESALMPPELSFEDYKALTEEWTATVMSLQALYAQNSWIFPAI